MNKLMIVATITWVVGVIWTTIEIIKGIKKWLKKEREEILKDE